MKNKNIKWIRRFNNYERFLLLLQEAKNLNLTSLNQLEKEGIIQRFEYTFELAWKVLKDKMEYDGLVFETISPKSVVKKAFSTKYINDSEAWLDMIGDRNLMSHTYDFNKFEEIILSIQDRYLNILNELYQNLLKGTDS